MMLEATPLLIDARMPSFDASIAEHVIMRRDPSTTFRVARELDFLSVYTPLLDLAMWARGLPARISGRAAPGGRSVGDRDRDLCTEGGAVREVEPIAAPEPAGIEPVRRRTCVEEPHPGVGDREQL